MTGGQAYATARSVCHLSIKQLRKKIRNTKNRGVQSTAARSEIKRSPNCLRILILLSYGKIRASRIGCASESLRGRLHVSISQSNFPYSAFRLVGFDTHCHGRRSGREVQGQ